MPSRFWSLMFVSAFLFALSLWPTSPAHAAYIEVGASANYRYSGYDEKDNYSQSASYTASFSYYFWETCAWEINYTTGITKQVTKGPGVADPKTTIEDNIEMTSLDLVLSFAERQDTFRPYIKLGVGYLTKERYRKIDDGPKELLPPKQHGMVPSGGVGFAIGVTKEISLKFGVDAWTSPLDQENLVVDYAGRAGISWMF